ncbi:methyltransferase domain-containing protein [Streptomyces sp. ISL-96]|uniref:methyltransferase domain-containing protein n=1 Tax=Streptomyces sp. ISL-96 TaxID=2819191 RepID=UPI00203552E3|nr:methyltransferase domain-containing protein [Streptomyces sp. ISL-96]
MTHIGPAEQIAMRGLLGAVNEDLGTPLSREWEQAFWAVPRHRFLPEQIWVGDGLEPCHWSVAPETWHNAAYADEPAVTQINDGHDPGDGDRWPSCSASAPSIVFRMLDILDVKDGHKVLEIGTGTGWNAGLLAHRVGSEHVTTVEVDPALVTQAANNLKNVRLEPEVIAGDGAAGHPDSAPYDRVIATCSVRKVPATWVEQTAPGGVILTPWETPWLCYGLLRLTVDGQAWRPAGSPPTPHSCS